MKQYAAYGLFFHAENHAQSYLSCRYKLFLHVFPVLFFHMLRKMLIENLLTTQAVKSSVGFYECPPLVAVGGIPNAWHEIETPKSNKISQIFFSVFYLTLKVLACPYFASSSTRLISYPWAKTFSSAPSKATTVPTFYKKNKIGVFRPTKSIKLFATLLPFPHGLWAHSQMW